MGVYSTNRYGLGNIEIEPDCNYAGTLGSIQIMKESYENDQAMFTAIISNDFMEAAAMHEGAELEILQEGSISSFIDKLKEMVKRVWAKITGLFKTAMAKINSILMKDSKELFNKYKKDFVGKDMSKMKFKWSKPTGKELKVDFDVNIVLATARTQDSSKLEKVNDEIADGTELESFLSKAGINCSENEFRKEAHEYFFEDEEVMDGMTSDINETIMSALVKKSSISSLEKKKKNNDKFFNDALRSIDKIKTLIIKEIPDEVPSNGINHKIEIKRHSDVNAKYGDTGSTVKNPEEINITYNDKETRSLALKQLNTASSLIGVMQKCANMIASADIEREKFLIKQCRRVFVQGVAFNPKSIKESALLVEAYGDASDYEIQSSYEDYEY